MTETAEAMEPEMETEEMEAAPAANTNPAPASSGAPVTAVGGIAADRLRGFVDRIERLEEEKTQLGTDLREVYAEAKALGFDPKIIRKVVSLRKKDPNDLSEEQAMLDTYLTALGM